MSLFRIYTYDRAQDLSRDCIAKEVVSFREVQESAQEFIDGALDLFESNYDELAKLIWQVHRAVTAGEYEKSFDTFRATEVIPFYLNTLRLVEEMTGRAVIANSCEHMLNVFWAHLKLTYDLTEAKGTLIAYGVPSFFKHFETDALALEEISWLAHISLASVANAASFNDDHSRKLSTIKRDGRTMVLKDIALKWLKGCPAFKSGRQIDESAESSAESKKILVPVAKDGSFINHTCVRTSGVQIGAKGSEVYVSTLQHALTILTEQRAEGKGPARWRRPNEKGNFGIVSAVRWEERSVDEVFGELEHIA